MANSEEQTPPSGQVDFNLWGMLDGLIDRLIHEGAALPYSNESYQLPNQTGRSKYDGHAHEKLSPTNRLHQYSNDNYEVANHHRKVTEKVRRSRSLFEPVSPYVLKHKHISELLDIMPRDQEKKEKKKMRRLKKLRAKPFREITDWGLTDSDTDNDSDEADDRPEINEKPMILGENTQGSLDSDQSKSLQGAPDDNYSEGEIKTNEYNHRGDSDVKSDEKLRTDEMYAGINIQENINDCTNRNCAHDKSHSAKNAGDVYNYDFTPKMEELHLDNFDTLSNLDLTTQVCAEDMSVGRQRIPEVFYGGEHLPLDGNDFTNFNNAQNGNIVTGHESRDPVGSGNAFNHETDFFNWTLASQHDPHPPEQELSTRTVQDEGSVSLKDVRQFEHSDAQNGPNMQARLNENQDEGFKNHADEFTSNTKEEIGFKADDRRQEVSNQRQQMNRDLIVEIGDIDRDEMDYILETLLRAQRNFKNVIPAISQEEFQQKMENYMERKKAELGDNDVTVTEADAKRVTLLEHVIKYFEKKIVEIVKFAKCIPGFKELGVDDQANLIKVSRTESGLVGGVGVSLKEGVVKAENESAIPLDMIGSVVGPQYMREVYRVTSKIDSVKITEKEGALLRGITITYTDRCRLNEPEKVQSIQNKLVTCLMRVVEEESSDVSVQVRMGQLVEVLTTLRNYTDADSNLLQNALNKYPNYSSNDLVKEFLEPHQ